MNNLDGDARELMERFKRLHHLLQKDFFRSVTTEFKPTAAMILMRLWHAQKHGEGGNRVSDIAASMGITVPAVTQLVTGLEARGMVARGMDPDDRRAVRVTLTDGGIARLKPLFSQYRDGFEGLVSFLGDGDTAELNRLLARVETYFADVTGAKGTCE